MISADTAALLALILTLGIALFINRKKLHVERFWIFYAAMYKTQAGIKMMDSIAKKYRKPLIISAPIIIAVGFLGMILATEETIRGLINLFFNPNMPGVGLVLPIEGVKGVFYVPFFYWIISIFVILIIHEGMHGVMARAFNLPVKNSGLVVIGALIPLIPGAFVEPDEQKLAKAKRKEQLAVFAAGPVANIITGVLFLSLLTFAIEPLTGTFYSKDGVIVTDFLNENTPAEATGISIGDKITQIDNQKIETASDFQAVFKEAKPGDIVNVVTATAAFDVTLGENPNTKRALLGVYIDRELKSPTWATHVALWLQELIRWLAILSLGVGLFNLIPVGPIDGGRMFLTALQKFTHDRKASAIWKSVSFVLLGVLVTSLVFAFL